MLLNLVEYTTIILRGMEEGWLRLGPNQNTQDPVIARRSRCLPLPAGPLNLPRVLPPRIHETF